MRMLDRNKIAQLFRERRRELKLKLEDLADESVSVSTISNIERVVANVTNEKIIYLGNRLGFNSDELPDFSHDTVEGLEDVEFDFLTIESLMESNPKKALDDLGDLNLKKDHPLSYLFHFLSGKCYFNLRDLAQAEIHFLEAINLLNHQSPQLKKSNIISASYYELSRTVYYKNELKSALKYTQEGLNHFIDEGEKQHYKHFLLAGKSVYLEKLDRLEESMRDLDLLDRLGTISSNEVKLIVCEQRSKILKKFKMYDEAIDCAKKGIRMAHVTKTYDRELDLWTLLGCMYVEIENLTVAEKCFITALELKEKMNKEYLFVTTYTQLGILYTKQEKWVESQNKLEVAVNIGQKTNDGLRYTQALVALADCLEKQKLYSEAIQTYKKALKVAKTHSFISLEQELNHKLGTCYKRTGDLSNYKICVDRFFEIGLQL
jgi:tetratricopeptide (TPR) repeat protein